MLNSNETQLGCVIVFRKGTSQKDAQKALQSIKSVIDANFHHPKGEIPPINEFETEYGGPVWYVP